MAITLDQTYSESNVDLDHIIHYSAALADRISQGFTPATSGSVPYIDLWIKRAGSPGGTIAIEIQNNSGGLPGGTVHATSETIAANSISTSYSKVRFYFPTPYSVTAGTTYHICTVVTYAYSTGANNILWGADGSSPSYSGGQDAFYNSGAWATNSRDNVFDQYVVVEDVGTAPSFEKHIALSHGSGVGIGDITTTSATYTETTNPTYIYLDTSLYNGATYYFEAVLKTSAGTAYAQLYDTAGNAISGTEVSTASTTLVRVRSAAFTPSATGTYTVRIKNNGTNTTTYYRSSIVIVQSASTISTTETRIPLVGRANTTTGAAYADLSTIDWGFFRYTSANWDGTIAIYLEATIKTTAGTGTVALHDSSNNLVTNSECTTTSSSYTRVRSSAISLTNATDYKIRVKTTAGTFSVSDAHIVIQQTNNPTKTECYIPINKTTIAYSATGGFATSNMPTDYTSTNWYGNSVIWFHEISANSNTASGAFEIYKETDAARLTGSYILSTAPSTITRYRSGALTMPSSQSIISRTDSAAGTIYTPLSSLIALLTWTNTASSGFVVINFI